jgi:uncharacterized membrane protein YtjA (UPF0391 family)
MRPADDGRHRAGRGHWIPSWRLVPRTGGRPGAHSHFTRSFTMLHYAIVFFIIALVAALFGFGGIAAGAVGIAKLLFFVFVILAVASLLYGLIRRT